jgi:hypothetical protein
MIKFKNFIFVFLLTVILCLNLPLFIPDTFAVTQVQSTSPIPAKTQVSPVINSTPNSVVNKTSSLTPSTTKVNSIYKYGGAPNDGAAINDIIVMTVDNLKSYYHEQEKLCKKQNPQCSPKIVLNLDGRKVTGIFPESLVFDKEKDQGTLNFHLRRTPENDEAWEDLLGSPHLDANFFQRDVKASISLENSVDSTPIATEGFFKLVRFRLWHIAFWTVLLGAIAALLIFHLKGDSWDLIRENGPKPSMGGSKPYSLGRCQMAWWLFVVVVSYILIYMTTGATDTLNNSILILLGIGSGTALGAVSIDVATNSNKPQTSQGFWKDLLNNSEHNGPGLHRLQLIIWTVILTVVFIVSVHSRLSMPQFSNVLLALQGISSGTYLGFKFPENLITDSPKPK